MTDNDGPLYESFPEIANLPAPVQDELVTQSKASADAFINRIFKIILLSLIGTTTVLLVVGYLFLPAVFMFAAISLLLCAYSPGIPPTIKNLLALPRQRTWIKTELHKRQLRPAKCFSCGYDLRGTPEESTSCPECGAKIAAVTVSGEN